MKIVAPKSRIARWDLGKCTSDNDTDYIYVPLPKCASRYTVQILNYMCGWTETDNFKLNQNLKEKKKLVVLRDPLSRWFSGIVHHFHLQQLEMKENNMHYIVHQLALDPHSELQVNYLEGLDTDECVFMFLDDNYKDTLKHFIINDLNKNYSFWNKKGTENIYSGSFREENQLLWFNRTQDRPGKQNNLKKLKKFFQDYPKYNAIVEDYLKPDYDFIKTVTFYKGPQNE